MQRLVLGKVGNGWLRKHEAYFESKFNWLTFVPLDEKIAQTKRSEVCKT